MADRLELSKAHLRMQEALKDPNLIDQIAYRIADGESIRDVCDAMRLPYGLMAKWIAEDDARRAKYEMALELKADSLAHEALEIADNADPEEIAKAKLQTDVRIKMAGKWYRKRYGEQVDNTSAALIGGLAGQIVEAYKRLEDMGKPKDITPLEGEFHVLEPK